MCLAEHVWHSLEAIRQILLFFPSLLLGKLEDEESSDLPEITETVGRAETAAKMVCVESLSLSADL